jgi:hypothetical protein
MVSIVQSSNPPTSFALPTWREWPRQITLMMVDEQDRPEPTPPCSDPAGASCICKRPSGSPPGPDAACAVGDTAASVATYRLALAASPDDAARCRAQIGLAEGLRVSEGLAEALELLDQAQQLAERHESRRSSATDRKARLG